MNFYLFVFYEKKFISSSHLGKVSYPDERGYAEGFEVVSVSEYTQVHAVHAVQTQFAPCVLNLYIFR